MMRSTRKWFGGMVFVLFAASSFHCDAGFFSKLNIFSRKAPKNRVETLMITGNFGKSRLLAELAQYKTKHPILVISPENRGDNELFFLPSGPNAVPVESGKYIEFVDFLHPKRVVFLGDSSFVPPVYVDSIRDRYPTVVVNSEDWVQNASALAVLLDYKKLPKEYSKYLISLEAAASGHAATGGGYATPTALEPQFPPTSVRPIGGAR